MAERSTSEISADLRTAARYERRRFLAEAADKLDGLAELLASVDADRDEARSEVDALRRIAKAGLDTVARVDRVLDEALGRAENDGTGDGQAADVYLLMQQRDEAQAEVQRLTDSESLAVVEAIRRAEHAEQTARLATQNLATATSERDDARAERDLLRRLAADALRAVHATHAPIPVAACRAVICRHLAEAVSSDA